MRSPTTRNEVQHAVPAACCMLCCVQWSNSSRVIIMMSWSRMGTTILQSCQARTLLTAKPRPRLQPFPKTTATRVNSARRPLPGTTASAPKRSGRDGRPEPVWGTLQERPLKLPDLKKTSVMLTIAVGVIVFSKMYVVETWRVTGASMEPTLPDGSLVLVNIAKRPRGFGGTQIRFGDWSKVPRGSIVVANSPNREDEEFIIKRVTGIPGDRILVRRPDSDVDNKTGIKTHEVVVPEDCYFLEGDNELGSSDSRFWGVIHGTFIRGIIFYTLTPDFRPIEPRPDKTLLERTPPLSPSSPPALA